MEGERILKALLNGETNDLFEDTKNYLSPLQSPLNAKNGSKSGCKVAEESVSKYTLFSTKFLRCAIETLKKVKAKGKNLDEITNSLNLVGTLLSDTLSSQNGKYLKFIPSLDQLGKTIYLIIVQLISKGQFDQAFCHANDLLKFIQLFKSWKNYDSGKMEKELSSLAIRTSDALLQGAGKLEEVKVTSAERASHLCVVLDWRKLSLLFQVEAVTYSSLKSLVDKTLKCGTKYQLDCGQKNTDFKHLANFFESVFNKLMVKFEQLITGGIDSILFVAELGFHFGRSCTKAEMSMQGLDIFDKLLKISRNVNHTKNGYSKLPTPFQVCCCICFVSKATILLNCSSNPTLETLDSLQVMMFEGSRLLSQLLQSKGLSSAMLKIVSDSLEYFRITVQNFSTKEPKRTTCLSWRICQDAMQLLKLDERILSLQCEHIKHALHKANGDNLIAQFTQQLQKTTARQLTVLNFVVSSYQDQLKSDKNAKDCDRNSRIHILEECVTVAQQASKLIHNALEDPDIPLSLNELRWLGSAVYNVGCVSYQIDCFAEGVPLLVLACDELKIWSFGAETEEKIIVQAEEVKLLTKYALLVDCQRRAGRIRDALKTATTLVLIALKTASDAHTLKQQVKQWVSVKHELVKNLQEGEKLSERYRTLCSAFAEQEDAKDVEGSQLCFVLQEELACYKTKSYDTAVEQIAVIKQLRELYIVHKDEFHFASAALELAIALHSLGDVELEEERSALQYCQEAGEILEQFLDSTDSQDEEKNMHSHLLDRLGAVYLWQALLEHKEAVDERATSARPELSDSYEAEEIEDVCLEQPFMESLCVALEMWTSLRTKSLQQDTSGKVKLDHLINPEETYHYLLITAEMFGLLKQPLKKASALYMAANISQSVGTKDMLDNGLCALSDAVHSLCDILDLSHASIILSHASNLVDRFEPCSTSWVQFLLAKSHYLLVTGKFSEGEDSLKEALQGEVFTHKSYKSHLLKARWKSICCKYAMLPPTIHEFKIIVDPLLGSLTPLEWAMDELHKLTQMAEEIFGLDVFCTGKQIHKQKENLLDLLATSESSGQSLCRLSILNDLLSSLLQVGQLYAHQGAVREALRQFVDGVALARQFCLPYRTTEFLINIAQLEVMQGKTEKSQCGVDQVERILQPTVKSTSKSKLSECCVEEPLFTEHPQTCECVSCLDPVLHIIFVEYLMSLANHLALTSGPEQSLQALDVAKLVCETAMCKVKRACKRLDAVLYHSETNDGSSKGTKKRKGANSGRGRKQKKDTAATESSISQSIFDQHQVTLHCMNAKTLLQNGNLTKANLVLSEAMVLLHCLERVNESTPVHLVISKAILLHLHGVAALLENRNLSGEVSVDCNWFLKTQMSIISCGNTEEISNPVDVVKDEECELEMPRKASNRKTRTSKTVEKTSTLDNGRKKSSRAKGRGKSKKVMEELQDCDKSEANTEQKPKQQTKKPSKAICNDEGDHIQASSKQLDQAAQYFREALNLCQACPPPSLFSDACQGLAFCLGRSAPELATYYLNLSMSVTLRHQAVTRTGKRIKRIAKDFSKPLENKGDMVKLTEHLSSLSLEDSSTNTTHQKLAALVKNRNIMKFSLRATEGGKLFLFTPEEISLLQNMPKEWTVCTLETFTHPVSKDRELLISRIRAGCDPTVVKINTTSGEEQNKDCTGDKVVMDLSKLFQSGALEEFTDIMTDSIRSMNINNTTEWWALRTRLDRRMKNLLEKLEGSWLGRWRGVLLGQPISEEYHESIASLAGELEEKVSILCGCRPDNHLLEVLIDSSFCLSRKETAEALIEVTGVDATLPSFEKLLDEVEKLTDKLFEDTDKKSRISRFGGHSAENIPRHPVILILGKDIQHLPWESIPMLFDQPVTRVPSLQFLLSKLSCQRKLPEIDPGKTFYALNPQNNLPNTQKMFQKWFESEHGWQGITGKAPTQEEFRSALTDHDLFIYFGHGTGREFLQGDDIQRLDCRAVTLLMGCSSGKLQVGGQCEPRGMALNYLLAGCPAIVANLWDVTDKDIDRFSELLLKQWLKSGSCFSLPQVLSQSRQACKLKYLIGASPVLYGLPAYTKEQNG